MEQSGGFPKQRSMKGASWVELWHTDPCRQREAADQVQRAQSESQGDMLAGYAHWWDWRWKAPVGFFKKK